jgi:hypothetical protein
MAEVLNEKLKLASWRSHMGNSVELGAEFSATNDEA